MVAKSGKMPKPALPSKDELLAFIRENEGKTSRRDIARAFGIKGEARVELKRLLRDLADDGAIDKPKGRIEERGRLAGVMVLDITETDTDGELFGRPAEWSGEGQAPKIRLVPGRTERGPALGVGERVLARVGPDDEGGIEARLVKRLGASAHEILAVLKRRPEGLRAMPVDRKTRGELAIAAADLKGAEAGELVLCGVLPDRGYGLRHGRVKDRLGHMDAPQAISLIAIHSHRLPTHFPDEALAEAQAAMPVALSGREDLRKLPFVTIDPEDARDHDDAVYAERDLHESNPGGFIVWVAIADVAAYVRPGAALDRAALKRGNSVYFPDRVVPMLPEKLSADLCSLREGEPRPVLAARMIFTRDGTKKDQRLVRALMRSAARLTYRQTQDAWDGTPDAKTGALLEPVLKPLFAAYEALKTAREKRSPLDLDLPEHRIRFGADGKIADVARRERLESMRLIEEFMIQANVAAAEILEAKRLSFLYRVHEPPDNEKLNAFRQFVESLDFTFPAGHTVRPQTFNRLIEAAKATDYAPMLHEVILRTQSQARYAPDRLGHFGLNLRSYAHFTSPIRRYADLVVHRALIRALGLGEDGLTDAEIGALGEIGEQVSNLERRAMAAERDATDRYLAAFLSDRVGASFAGRICGVTRFGLFVRLDETGADGIVPIRTLGRDYFHHDERAHALIGDTSGAVYRLGERVEVKLIEAAPITGGLVFELLSEPKTFAEKKPRKGGGGRVAARGRPGKKPASKRGRRRDV
jgi:ribonuclease R